MLARLKKRATQSGSTVSQLIEESVRVMLNRPAKAKDPSSSFELVTFGEGGRFSRYNVDKAASWIAAEDLERYGEQEGDS